jgi:FolB domain-containing protein
MDEIFIRGLRLPVFIGVPDSERALPQEIEIDISMRPCVPFDDLEDDIARTVDYASVAVAVEQIVSAHPRRLIETLASDIAHGVLAGYPAVTVAVEIRKFILPNTAHVAVRCCVQAAKS